MKNRQKKNESIVVLQLGIKQRPQAISCQLRLEIPLFLQTHAPCLVKAVCVCLCVCLTLTQWLSL